MASKRATHIGLEQVLQFYEECEYPYFVIFDGKTPLLRNNTDDEGADKLARFIKNDIANGNFATRELAIFEKPGNKNLISDAYECIRFASSRPLENEVPRYFGNSDISNRITALESKINAFIDTQTDEVDDDETAELGKFEQYMPIINGINGILSNPIVTNVLANLFTNKLVSTTQNQQASAGGGFNPPKALAGVENDVEVLQLWNILENKGAKIEHLRKLAALPESSLTSLLKMLA